jgi:hypothetical protein
VVSVPRRGPRSALAAIALPAFALLVAAALLGAIAGGLLRADAAWPALRDSTLAAQAAVRHAALMLPVFLGTVVAIERAVALKRPWGFAAPALSGVAGLALLAGATGPAAGLMVMAALLFTAVNMVVVARQRAAHTVLLLAGALALLIGNGLFALGDAAASTAVLSWWFAFPVLTIAAERLEMTRLTRRHPSALPTLLAAVAALGIGAALTSYRPVEGGALYGVALMALAAWLFRFDIARRTVRAEGLARYMAVCLLAGYAWLAIAGLAWLGMALGCPGRDMALHALGLGFIVSMVMGHAPVILPAVARVKLHFSGWFYLPLALLHGSLALRLFGGSAAASLRTLGTALNAVSLAVFVATVVVAAVSWRHRPA